MASENTTSGGQTVTSPSHPPSPKASATTLPPPSTTPIHGDHTTPDPPSNNRPSHHHAGFTTSHTPAPLPLRLLLEPLSPLPCDARSTTEEDTRLVKDFWSERYLARGSDQPPPLRSSAAGSAPSAVPPTPRENAWPPAPLTPELSPEYEGEDDVGLIPKEMGARLPSSLRAGAFGALLDEDVDLDQGGGDRDGDGEDDGYEADSESSAPTSPMSVSPSPPPSSPASSALPANGATTTSPLSPASPWSTAFRKRHGLFTRSRTGFGYDTPPGPFRTSIASQRSPAHDFRRRRHDRLLLLHPLAARSPASSWRDPSSTPSTVRSPSPPWPIPYFPPAPYERHLERLAGETAPYVSSSTAYDDSESDSEDGNEGGDGDSSPLFPRPIAPTPGPAMPPGGE